MIEPIPLRASGPHPDPDELYRASHDPGDAAAERTLRHAAGCALCSAELARQEAFDQPERLPAAALDAAWQRFSRGEPAAGPVPVRLRRRQSRWTPALALAATLTTCVLGLGLWMIQREHSANDVERGAQAEEVTAGWSPSGLLKAPPAAFNFPAPGEGPRRVKVFDAAQSYEWTSKPTFTGRVAFPAAEQGRLQPGLQYFWTVVGGSGEGTATQSFRINP
jgi:hypothetical protein